MKNMLDQTVVQKLRERYAQLNPLLFYRSCERAKTNGDLFDILETIPKGFPLIWCEADHCWKKTKDLYVTGDFFNEKLND